MHTILMIGGGAILLGLFLLFGHLWGSGAPALVTAAKAFLPVWLALSLVNLWIGVAKAGYSLRDELPVLLGVFAVPAIIAGVIIWRLTR
ncbi:hypothetical protein [Dyella sp. GSA-30]|uniref:hypothetical protein n=1 Tax=Dyella sp. GSA-30 TaxID=2994496 RepID=UPI0024900A19|nr:hypothetical protein [Dyella sp. GSA-30]BDU22162.1 hypothetical protein DYGSA30_36190 [Dyella sp. GSA-30]